MLVRRIELASADLSAQARFWRDTLGLPVVEDERSCVEVRLRRTTIAFVPSAAGDTPQYHFAINIPRFRAADALAWLAARVEPLPFADGAAIVRFDFLAADAVYFADGGGNVVELIAREPLAYDTDAPFGPSLLLEVSEIGVASSDVRATGEALMDALGAPLYWGGLDGSRLAAVGDAIGAVLVAPIGRGWIPIDLPARPAPTRVLADGPTARVSSIPGGPYVVETVTAGSPIP